MRKLWLTIRKWAARLQGKIVVDIDRVPPSVRNEIMKEGLKTLLKEKPSKDKRQ